MKLKSRLFSVSPLPLAICLAVVSLAQGATLYWDGGTTNIGGTGDGASAGGTGTWNTTIQNWDRGNGLSYVAWPNDLSDEAVFAGTAGTVTIGSGVTINANKLTFNIGNYTIAGADSTSVLNFTGTTPTIAGSGKTYFTSRITGSSGITISSGSFNVFTGDLSGLSGTVNVNARATLQGAVWGGGVGNGAGVLSGSQFQTWNVTDILTSNNKGTGATIQLGALSGSGLVRNGNDGDGSPLSGTDTFQVGALNTSTTFSGTIQNFGGAVAALTKVGNGTLTLSGSNSYSGNTVVNGGILAFSGSGSVYNNGANAGTIIVNNGGTLRFDRQDVFGGHTSVPTATATVNSGGLISGNGFYNTLNNLTLNGGTLQTASGDGFWGSFALKGTVTVGGSSASNISSGGSTANFIRIGTNTAGGATIFNVADSTGNANTDLTISAQLTNNKESGSPFADVASGLTKSGLGTMTLTSLGNNYTGGTTISAGTLEIGNGSTNGSMPGTYSIGSSGTLRLNYATAAAPTWANITGAGTLSVRSAAPNSDWGSPALASGFTGTLQIESGRLNNGTLGNATSVVVQNGGQYANWNGGTFAQNFTIAGTGWAAGDFEAVSLRLGDTRINGTVTLAGSTTIASGGTSLFTNVISGAIGSQLTIGTPALASSIAFSGANTYAGGTSVTAGTLSVGQLVGNSAIEGSSTSLGTGSVNVASGAQLVLAGNNISIGNNVTLNGAATVGVRQGALMGGFQDGGSANTLSGTLTLAGTGDRTISTWWSDKTFNLSGKVTGTGNLRIVNASTTGGNGGSIVILSNATNDYSGNTIVDGGGNGSTQTLRLGANNVIPDGAGKGDLFVDGRLELNGFNETVNGISTGSGVISLSSGNTLTVGNNNANGDTFTVLTGLGNLTKIGSGTQILRGTSDFSGTTTISGGTLQVSVNGSTASLGSGNIVNNATLAFQRQNEITVNNAISGTGALSQIGTGTLILAGTNKTYTGATNVNSGSLQLTGSLSNSAISVASGARFSPTVTTSAGLSSGSAGASLTLSAGSILDMTSVGAGTINTFTLNPGSNTFAGQALSLAGANLRFDLGSSSADRLTVNSGTATVTGTNNIRFNTGSSMTTGSRTLISAASGLAGNFQFEGGSSLGISAQQQIKNIGGTYYRLTLENSNTTQQVVVSAAPSNVINIMPLGSSITAGIASEQGGATTYAGGGYRSQLYQNLVNDGRFTPHFVGSATDLNKRDSSKYNVLEGANELNHEGHSGYTTTQILKNLSANGGDVGNNGGFWLQNGNGVNPDYVALSIGGNDYGANGSETTGPLKRTDAIVSQLQSLRPDSHIIVSNLFYRTQTAGGNSVGDLQNAYYNPGVQAMVFNHVLAGQHVSFYDAYSAITPGNNMANIFDGIHPDQAGYNALANGWYDALANGSAFWTGSSGGTWSSPANFAQNHQRTTIRQMVPGASTDVHFNSNASPLGTTLGQNTSVRGLNFAAGAAGAITIGGANTLTLGAGGITVQAGTGAHEISSSIGLGASQTWGNVSSNAFTIGGDVSGSASLNLVGSYTVELPGSLVGSTYTTTTQTVTGTGGFVLNGANTHSGGTTINAVTVGIGHNTALGTGTVVMNHGATLSNSSLNALTVGNDLTFGPTGSMKFVANKNLTMTGGFSGGAGGVQINVQGPGTLTLSDTARTVGSGATPAVWTVNGGGTLALTRGNNLGTLPAAAAAQIILDNGTFSTVTAGGNFFPERGLQVNAAGGTWHDAAGGIEFTGAVLNNGPFTANTAVSNATSTLSGVVSGSGSLIKTGAGSLALTAANTYTGAITINAGSLVVGAAGANDGSTSTLGAANTGKAITVGTGATLTGTVNNWFGNQTNAGTLPTITVNGGTLSTTRYTTLGGLTLNGATVTNAATDGGNYQAFAFRGNVTVGGSSASTMSATAATGTSQGYHLGSNTIFNVADATGNADADLIVSAPLRDQSGDFANAAGGLTKNGGGTLMLGGVNTYTGATAVNAGTLTISGSIENSAVTVSNPGTTIASGATGTLGSSLTVNSGAILAAGGAAADGIATVTGGTILMSGSIFSWDISSNGLAYDKLMTASLAGDGSQESVVFRIVAADSSFSDSFWNQSRSWSDIFTKNETNGTNGTSATAISNWANLFSVSVVNSSYQPITPVNGSFSVSGSALTWSAVPEPSNAVVGLLLASSLLRRRRTAGAPARTAHSRV